MKKGLIVVGGNLVKCGKSVYSSLFQTEIKVEEARGVSCVVSLLKIFSVLHLHSGLSCPSSVVSES